MPEPDQPDLKADFAGAQPPVLYHCINRPITGDALLPTCRRTVNGREDDFLFAATHLSKALAFAFDYHGADGIVCNGAVSGTPDEFVIICNRDKTLNELPPIKVYAFPSQGFAPAWPGTDSRQSVSTQAMPLASAKLVLETGSVDDLMRHGLQIFSTDKTFEELGGNRFFESSAAAASNEDWIARLYKSGGFHWENNERGINPTPKLRAMLMPQAAQPTVLKPGP
jgi:hypothetical protein